MTLEEANKILDEECALSWIEIYDNGHCLLDGSFSLRELNAIIVLINARLQNNSADGCKE